MTASSSPSVLDMFQKITKPAAPKILIYGPPGCGKTKVGAAFGGLHMDIEGSARQYAGMNVAPAEMFPDYPSIRSVLQQLAVQGCGPHRCLVIDTFDWLMNKVAEYILDMDGKKVGDAAITNTLITAHGGYAKARDMVERVVSKEIIPLLSQINAQNVCILLLSHAQHLKFKDAEGVPIALAAPDFDAKSLAVVVEWADAVIAMRQDTTTDGVLRQLGTVNSSRGMAKNRWDLDPVITYDTPEDVKKIIFGAIAKKFAKPKAVEAAPAPVVTPAVTSTVDAFAV